MLFDPTILLLEKFLQICSRRHVQVIYSSRISDLKKLETAMEEMNE